MRLRTPAANYSGRHDRSPRLHSVVKSQRDISWSTEARREAYRSGTRQAVQSHDEKVCSQISLFVINMQLTMLRTSFFGTQEGDFSLSIRSISALAKVPDSTASIASRDLNGLEKGLPAIGVPQAGPRSNLPIVLIGTLCLFALYYFAGRRACTMERS
jgi:hypothetical protein